MDKKEKLGILSDLIAINSVNGNELEVANYLKRLLEKHGISSRLFPFGENRANLIVEIGNQKTEKCLVLTGHQDTVAVNQESSWKYPPFKATQVGKRIYGRGAADMKSGLAAQVISLIELAENNVPLNGTLRLIITSGEEYGAVGAYRVPDRYLQDADAMVIGEASNGDVVYSHAGSVNYQIESIGRASHSSRPYLGINAISGLREYLDEENQLFNSLPTDPILGKVAHSITEIKGGKQINSIPDQAVAYGNVRPTNVANNQQIINLIETAVGGINDSTDFDLHFKVIHDFYPVETKKDNPFVQMALKIAQKTYSEKESQLVIAHGATDASAFVKVKSGVPTISLGPANYKTSHQVDEYTTISSYLETITAYQEIAKQFLK